MAQSCSPSSSPRHIVLHPTASHSSLSVLVATHTLPFPLTSPVSLINNGCLGLRCSQVEDEWRWGRLWISLPSAVLCISSHTGGSLIMWIYSCAFSRAKTSFLATTSYSPVFLGSLGWGCTDWGGGSLSKARGRHYLCQGGGDTFCRIPWHLPHNTPMEINLCSPRLSFHLVRGGPFNWRDLSHNPSVTSTGLR